MSPEEREKKERIKKIGDEIFFCDSTSYIHAQKLVKIIFSQEWKKKMC